MTAALRSRGPQGCTGLDLHKERTGRGTGLYEQLHPVLDLHTQLPRAL